MKTDFRFPPHVLIILTGLMSAFFILASSSSFLAPDLSSARAQSYDQRLLRLKSQIHQLIKKGTYVPALTKVKLYVRLMAKKHGTRHPEYARALQLQAKVYRYLKRPKDARKYELRAAAILKNHRKFTAKRKADIQAARARADKQKVKMKAKLQRERLAAIQRQRRSQQPSRPLAKQKPVLKSQKSPTLSMRKPLNRPASRPVIKQKKMTSAARRDTNRSQMRAAKPKSSYQTTKRSTRTTRSQPKTIMRRSATAPRNAPVAKSISPAAPGAAAPPPAPAPAPRSFSSGPSGGSSPQTGAGAVSDREETPAPPASPAPLASNENHTIVKVYFATDRQRTASTKLASMFGGQPSEPKRISYGICEVSIPKGHKPGALEAPSIWRFEFKEDPDKHVVLLKVHTQQKQSYFRNLKRIISRSKGQNAFIFIHGYNVTFTDAARRTAQIAYDLGFNGAPVFYSWPSTGELAGYPTDEDNVAWAQENVKQFLKDFVEKTDAKNIYLVAHSMGSRALTGAIASLVAETPKFNKRFKEIILAAPDISARIFRDNIAPKMIEASNNITLYVSGDDKALAASRKFHANPRAGETGKSMIIFKGIDTIDATGIDASLLAHSYFAEAKSIIADIISIIRGEPASGRDTLKQIKTDRGAYWAFAK